MARDIDVLIDHLCRVFPGIEIEQLKVSHPGADDEGLWFVRHPGSAVEAQIESGTGRFPFIVEWDGAAEAVEVRDVAAAVKVVGKALGLG